MKRIIATFICIEIIFSMCACSSQGGSVSSYRDENGNFIIEEEGHRTVMPEEIPFDLPYNGSTITLSDVQFYENCVGYSYTLFTIVTLDVSQLDEASLHWLRESDLDVHEYITSEENDYDFDRASPLGSVLLTDSKELVFVFISSMLKENRKSFAGSEISIVVEATQEEKYEYKNSNNETVEANKTEEINYSTETGGSINNAEYIKKPLYDYVSKWLREKANSIF